MAPLNEVLSYASLHAFQMISLLALILVVVFGAIWLYDKSRGGYKAEVLVTDAEPEATRLGGPRRLALPPGTIGACRGAASVELILRRMARR
jgi:hypothetical protein